MLAYNETPMFLQLSPDAITGSKDLPVTIYESITEIISNQPQTKFIVAPYRVETGEAERVAVDHASKSSSAGTGDSSCEARVLLHLVFMAETLQCSGDQLDHAKKCLEDASGASRNHLAVCRSSLKR